MKLNVLSDLHLSFGSPQAPDNDADVVILAGDIARPPEAIAWAQALAKPTVYVAGNHEFYGGSLKETIDAMRRLSSGTNVRVLDDDEITIDGVRFIGTTLWTDFMLFGNGPKRHQAIAEAQRFMRDFSRIRMDDETSSRFAPEDAAIRFRRHSRFIAEHLASSSRMPTVVITHHAPSPRSIHPRFAGSLMNACFVSDAEHLLDGSNVALWVHGHTHDSFDYPLNGTRVVCNPRGYARNGVNENPRFDLNFCVEV